MRPTMGVVVVSCFNIHNCSTVPSDKQHGDFKGGFRDDLRLVTAAQAKLFLYFFSGFFLG